ncbi:hypothetical protein LLE49_23825 [Alicyclobacillus tolerans]|uniref:hypothetical protein n=1 Tax=Alicyclobacillus tolerans TaxID=90970 RepID=UPI001F423B2E|nr:hypothetical protein [Alicyclobacillus tolerans]MCF8567754.1 hypothetical protein [Alicyclobacillus tolerans]
MITLLEGLVALEAVLDSLRSAVIARDPEKTASSTHEVIVLLDQLKGTKVSSLPPKQKQYIQNLMSVAEEVNQLLVHQMDMSKLALGDLQRGKSKQRWYA